MKLFSTYSLFAILILLAACSRQPSITGEWRLEKVKWADHRSGSAISIDLSDPERTRKQFDSLFLHNLPPEEYETQEIKSEIDTMLAYAQLAGLRLSSNHEFGMDNYGLIVPKVAPGWNFGDRMLGEWELNTDTLALTIGDGEVGYTFRFIVLEKSSKTLKLRELPVAGIAPGDTIIGNEIIFIRK